MASHFLALPLEHSFEIFLAFLAFLPHQLVPFLSTHAVGGDGAEAEASHTPHDSSHLAETFFLLHLLSFLEHHLEPFLSSHAPSSVARGGGAGGGGAGGDGRAPGQ